MYFCAVPDLAPAYPTDEYVSPRVREGVALTMAPSTTPDTKEPLPDIVLPRPAITPAMVHTNVDTATFEQCWFPRWVAENPVLAGIGALGLYFLLAGRKAGRTR